MIFFWLLLTMVTTQPNAGTDHTREYIPFLAYSPSFKGSGVIPVGHFADISATVADNFGVEKAMIGESFLDKLV